MEQVQGDFSLGQEAVPKTEGEGFGGAGKDTEEMGFEVADDDLCCITAMATGQNEFYHEVVLGADVFFRVGRDLLSRTCFLGCAPARRRR